MFVYGCRDIHRTLVGVRRARSGRLPFVVPLLLKSIRLINVFINKYHKDDDDIIKLIIKYKLNKLNINMLPNVITQILDTNNSIPDIDRVLLSRLSKKCHDFYIFISFKEIMIRLQTRKKAIDNCNTFLSIAKDIEQTSGFAHLFSGEQNDPHEFLVYLLDKIHTAKSAKVTINIPNNYESVYLKL